MPVQAIGMPVPMMVVPMVVFVVVIPGDAGRVRGDRDQEDTGQAEELYHEDAPGGGEDILTLVIFRASYVWSLVYH